MNFLLNSLLPLVGGIVVFAAFAGLGYLVRGMLGARCDCSIAEATAVGLGMAVLIGGFLNLVNGITLPIVLALEAIGLAGLASKTALLWKRARYWLRDPALLIILAVLLLYYLRSVSNVFFEPGDDLNGYLVPIEKLVQTGGLGSDPFLEKRLTGEVGSYFFLEAIFVFQLGYHHITILEPGFGILLGVLSTVHFVRKESVPRTVVVATALSGAAALSVIAITATAAVFQAGLLIVLVFKLLSGKIRRVADTVSVGLIMGTALSLKIQVLPFVGVLALAWLVIQGRRHRDLPELAGAAAVVTLVSLTLLAPWMLALYLSSGTFLFPLLGGGYYSSAYGTVASPSDGLNLRALTRGLLLTKRPLLGISLLAGSIIAIYRSRAGRSAADDLMVTLAILTIPLVLLIFVATGGAAVEHGYRYAHSTYAAVAVPGSAWAARKVFSVGSYPSIAKIFTASAAIILLGCLLPPYSFMLKYFAEFSYVNLVHLATADADLAFRLSKAAYSLNAPLDDADERSRLLHAQETTKQNATILADLQRPYLLNFRRNVIWSVGNCPAGSSPPPGFPIEGSSKQLEKYLRAAGVDYIIFQYDGPQPWFDIQLRAFEEGSFKDHRWAEDCTKASVGFQAALGKLMASEPMTYKDDRFAVISVIRVE
jgi:hypothetical protein